MNVIYPVATGAYLYHEDTMIRGVSFIDDETLAYDKLIIPVEAAVRFIQGEWDHRDWLVLHTQIGLAVYSLIGDGKLPLPALDNDFTRLVSAPANKMGLTIKLYRKAQRVVFQVNVDLHADVDHLPFMFVVRDDPTAVLHRLDVAVEPLLADKMVELALPIDPNVPLDIYTRRLFPAYQIENLASDENLRLVLPVGHFVDLMQFEHGVIQRGLQAMLRPAERLLHLGQVGQMVETYDRSTDVLRLLFSMPGDPALLLHTVSVPVLALAGGTTIGLPKILDRPFDLWAPLMYRRAAILEVISNEISA